MVERSPNDRAGGTLALRLALLLTFCSVGGSFSASLCAQEPIGGFVRGECSGDGSWDVGDPILFLSWLLSDGAAPPCSDACDSNDDGLLDISDGIHSLGALFVGTALPPAPYPQCGFDPTPDDLPCEVPPCTLISVDADRVVVLPTTRLGRSYTAALPSLATEPVLLVPGGVGAATDVIVEAVEYIEYGLAATAVLPPGLHFEAGTGLVWGTPESEGHFRFDAWAEATDGTTHRLEIELAIFSPDESEIVAGQLFPVIGPHAVAVENASFLYTHELPWPTPYPLFNCSPNPPATLSVQQAKLLRVHRPVEPGDTCPVVIFRPGTGFQAFEYDGLLAAIASHGFICVAIDDGYSYGEFTTHYCWGGHDEAARVMVAARAALGQQAGQGPLAWLSPADLDRVFYAGHSRGGASAFIAASLDRRTCGVLALQPTDAKGDSFIGNTDRWDRLPALPALTITAEQDTDVSYPWSERLAERTSGPTTTVTIYGGCHGFTTDSRLDGCAPCSWIATAPEVDLCPYITREDQHAWSVQFAVAFLSRWGHGDLSVEGQLYGDEWLGSPHVALSSRRELFGTRWVDDFDSFPIRSDGSPWIAVGSGSIGVGACYDAPLPGNLPIPSIENLIVEPADDGSPTILFTPLGNSGGGGLDLSGHRDLVFRLKNHDRWQLVDNFGFSWLTFSIVLVDLDGTSVAIPTSTVLPDTEVVPGSVPVPVPLKAQRFVDVRIPLVDFLLVNPGLDLLQVVELRLEISVDPDADLIVPPTIGIDDLRFE